MSFAKPGPFEAKLQDKIIGVFFVLASVALIYSIYIVKTKDMQVEEWIDFHSLVSKSYSLAENSNITISGINIGKVTAITLQSDAKVRIDMVLDPQYSALYKSDSYLKINSSLGIDTVLSGSNMEFVQGNSSELLKRGAHIAIEEPKSLEDLMAEWELEKLSKQVKDIVSNLQSLSENVAGQQDKLNTTLGNMGDFSGQLVVISKQVPPLLDNINRTNTELQKSISSIDNSINTLTTPVKSTLVEAEALLNSTKQTMETLNPVLEEARSSLESLEPTFDKAPELLESLNETANSVSRLTNQMSKHWLLGGKQEDTPSANQVQHKNDKELYQGL